MNIQHHFLARAASPAAAEEQARAFLDKTLLVRYAEVSVESQDTMSGEHPRFWPTLAHLADQHHDLCRHFLASLRDTGIATLDDLLSLEQGYQSKLLHIFAHLVDGFFGIDSVLFNLVEDSHVVSANLRAAIKEEPRAYYLLTANCSLLSVEEASIIHRRPPNHP